MKIKLQFYNIKRKVISEITNFVKHFFRDLKKSCLNGYVCFGILFADKSF